MPDIRDLGMIDGKPARGYEVDFDVEKEPWSEYMLADGTRVRVKNTVIKMFLLVDENEQPEVNEIGEPKILVQGSITVVSRKKETEA